MNRTSTTATARQLDTIRAESRRAGFTDPSYAVEAAGITSRNWRYDLSRADASQLIDALRDGLAPEPEPIVPGVVEGAPNAEQALATLGRQVTVTTASDHVGRVEAIVASPKDGTPALSMVGDDGEMFVPRLSVIRRLRIEDAR